MFIQRIRAYNNLPELLIQWLRLKQEFHLQWHYTDPQYIFQILITITHHDEFEGGLGLFKDIMQRIYSDVVTTNRKYVSGPSTINGDFSSYYVSEMSAPLPDEVSSFVISCSSTSDNNNNNNSSENNSKNANDNNIEQQPNENSNNNNDEKQDKDLNNNGDDEKGKGFHFEELKNVAEELRLPGQHCGRVIYHCGYGIEQKLADFILEQSTRYDNGDDSARMCILLLDEFLYEVLSDESYPQPPYRCFIILKHPQDFPNHNDWKQKIYKQIYHAAQLNLVDYATIVIPSRMIAPVKDQSSDYLGQDKPKANLLDIHENFIKHDLGMIPPNKQMSQMDKSYIQQCIDDLLINNPYHRHATIITKSQKFADMFNKWDKLEDDKKFELVLCNQVNEEVNQFFVMFIDTYYYNRILVIT